MRKETERERRQILMKQANVVSRRRQLYHQREMLLRSGGWTTTHGGCLETKERGNEPFHTGGLVTVTRKPFPRISFPRKWRGRARLLDRDEAGEESTCNVCDTCLITPMNELSTVNAQFLSTGFNQWLKLGDQGAQPPAPIWAPCNSVSPWLNL